MHSSKTVWGVSGDTTSNMKDQMEKKMENEMETVFMYVYVENGGPWACAFYVFCAIFLENTPKTISNQ